MKKRIFPILFLLALAMTAARAGDKVEAALYLGQNGAPPFLSHAAPADLAVRLHQVFGFGHYQLLKAGRIDLSHPWKQWFVPRRDFFIGVTPQAAAADEPQFVDYEIYQEGFLVAKGKFEPSDGTPLFINGPDFKKGRLIFVLETQ